MTGHIQTSAVFHIVQNLRHFTVFKIRYIAEHQHLGLFIALEVPVIHKAKRDVMGTQRSRRSQQSIVHGTCCIPMGFICRIDRLCFNVVLAVQIVVKRHIKRLIT